MKRQISLISLYCFFSTVTFLSSCKKQAVDSSINNETVTKVNFWLENQKLKANSSDAVKIGHLKDKLDYSHLYFEEFNDQEKFIVIPIQEGLEISNNNDKHPVNALLLIENSSGNIRRGNIVQYMPQGGTVTRIPGNSFIKVFNAQKLNGDSKFAFLTITDRLLWEVKYKGGNIQSSGHARPGLQSVIVNSPPQDPIGPVLSCIDWYLLTTWFYEDGSTSQTQEYLYTICPDGSSGSGQGNENDTDFEYEAWKYSDLEWDVYYLPNLAGTVVSYDRFYGRINANHPDRNKFLGGDHTNNHFFGEGEFRCDTYGVTVSSATSANAACGGYLYFPDSTRLRISNSKTVAFSSLTWL